MADAVEHPGRVTEVREAEERRRMVRAIDRVRQSIGREVAFVGPVSGEPRELSRLAEIERGVLHVFAQFRQAKALIADGRAREAEVVLDRALREASNDGLRGTIDTAVEDQARDAAEARQRAERALHRVATIAGVGAVLVILLGVIGLILLLRRLNAPLRELDETARAVRAGDFTRRAHVGSGAEEFARVADSLNAMIGTVAAGRASAEEARRQLEAAVAARTAELASLNAALSESDGARRRFLADISHELRTPLTVIRGEAEITLRNPNRAPEEYRAALSRIVEQAAHTARLVDDLLYLARAEAGAPRLRMSAVALDALLRRVVEETAASAAFAQVTLQVAGPMPPLVVEADLGRLRQVAMILIENAIRYSRPGGRVEVALLRGPGSAVLRVSDDGIGIEEEELPHVFDRFFRGDRAQLHHEGGSGLGLPLARAIVEAHGGTIGLQSRPGEGTVATVALPLALPIEELPRSGAAAGLA
jgi:signal transduction histidine kinase